MRTMRLETKESVREKKLLPERDRLAFSLMERMAESPRPLILSDGEKCLLVQADVSSPVWVWTRSDVSSETLEELLLSLTALYDQGRLPAAVSKKNVASLISAVFEGRIKRKQILAVYRLDRLHPYAAEGEIIPGSDVSPDTAGEMIGQVAAFADEKISFETQRDMGLLFTQNPHAYAFRTPDGRIVSIAKIAYSDGRYADIHSVFTREELRNRGYAKALLSGICEKIRAEGKTPMLYADRDYAPSNATYRQLGFAEKASLCALRFTEPGQTREATCALGRKDV